MQPVGGRGRPQGGVENALHMVGRSWAGSTDISDDDALHELLRLNGGH